MTRIFYNGKIIPLKNSLEYVEALVVENEKIVFVGSLEEAKNTAPEAEQIDLQGKTLLPGFIEAHMHILNTASVAPYIDVSPFSINSYDEAVSKIKEKITSTPSGQWVLAFGYDPSLTAGPAEITVQDLDALSTNHPVMILNLSGHIAYVNTLAYQTAGVTKDTPDPVGGRFMKDTSGNLSGIVEEVGALQAFVEKIPPPSPDEIFKLSLAVVQDAAKHGCTTICDAGVGDVMGDKDVELLHMLIKTPQFPVRIAGFLTSLLYDTWKTFDWFYPDSGDDALRFIKIKVWVDGSTQGFTAAVRQPYLNTQNKGSLNYKIEDLKQIVVETKEAKWPVSLHCNGDAALEQALDVLEEVLTPGDSINSLYRIEHCTVVGDDLLERMSKLGLSPSFTIGHVYYWGKVFRDKILGVQRAEKIDSADFFVKNNLPFSYNSDAFTTPIRPLLYVQTGISRKMKDGGEVLGPSHCISLEQALKAVTIYPAMQLGMADKVGTLEVGKYADFVILERNPAEVEVDTISQIQILETWMNGEKVTHI